MIRTSMRCKRIIGSLILAGSLTLGGCSLDQDKKSEKDSRYQPKQEQAIRQDQQIPFQLSEDYILKEGISLNSDLWHKIKEGKCSGAGRNSKEWAEYLSQAESYRNNLFSRLSPSVRNDLDKYPFMIKGLGGGGSWSCGHFGEFKEWDDYQDLDKVKFDGVHLSYAKDCLPDESVIVHEYFHAIWDTYGRFAGKDTRKIDKEQFKADTERLVHDTKYKDAPLMEEIIEGWGLKDASDSEMKRLCDMWPDEFDEKDTIPQALTERFASLAEIFYKNPDSLPGYIKKHFEPVFKNQKEN